jgi:hypothetical protein
MRKCLKAWCASARFAGMWVCVCVYARAPVKHRDVPWRRGTRMALTHLKFHQIRGFLQVQEQVRTSECLHTQHHN